MPTPPPQGPTVPNLNPPTRPAIAPFREDASIDFLGQSYEAAGYEVGSLIDYVIRRLPTLPFADHLNMDDATPLELRMYPNQGERAPPGASPQGPAPGPAPGQAQQRGPPVVAWQRATLSVDAASDSAALFDARLPGAVAERLANQGDTLNILQRAVYKGTWQKALQNERQQRFPRGSVPLPNELYQYFGILSVHTGEIDAFGRDRLGINDLGVVVVTLPPGPAPPGAPPVDLPRLVDTSGTYVARRDAGRPTDAQVRAFAERASLRLATTIDVRVLEILLQAFNTQGSMSIDENDDVSLTLVHESRENTVLLGLTPPLAALMQDPPLWQRAQGLPERAAQPPARRNVGGQRVAGDERRPCALRQDAAALARARDGGGRPRLCQRRAAAPSAAPLPVADGALDQQRHALAGDGSPARHSDDPEVRPTLWTRASRHGRRRAWVSRLEACPRGQEKCIPGLPTLTPSKLVHARLQHRLLHGNAPRRGPSSRTTRPPPPWPPPRSRCRTPPRNGGSSKAYCRT